MSRAPGAVLPGLTYITSFDLTEMTTSQSPFPWTPIPILMYHAVEDETRDPQYKHFYVTSSEFDWQMRYLQRGGYTPIDFAQLGQALVDGILPARPVILTFDDGYENLMTNVYPLLGELNWPYTVFLVSDRIGATNEWVTPDGYDAARLLAWHHIHEMAANSRADFQPHTSTHPRLSSLAREALRRELVDSRDLLSQNLGKEMNVICYPYGDHNNVIVDAARDAGYTMGVTTNFGRVRTVDDPLRLPRISVYHVPPVSLTYGIGTLNFDWRVRTRKDLRPLPTGTLTPALR